MQIEEYVIRQRWITASKIILHIIQKPNSILSSKLWPISGYKQMFFFLDDTPQKVDRCNVHRGISMFCIFLPFFCSDLVRNSGILSLDRIIAESAICFSSLLPEQPRFQANIPSINLVFNMIRCILLAFFQITYSKRQLVMKNIIINRGLEPIRKGEQF